MRKFPKFFVSTIVVALAGLAHAESAPLPDGAIAKCVANADGTGTLTVTGVEVRRVELYVHAPISKKSLLDPAASYKVPASTTFNFVFKDKGEDRYVALGDESVAVAKVFKAGGGAGGSLEGIIIVPDAKHGGIGGPGASMGCAHMLRSKPSAEAKKTGA